MMKRISTIYLLEPSHVDYLHIIYPMFLLAVTCIFIAYIESYSPLACLGFVSSMCLYVVFPSMLVLCFLACVGCIAHHIGGVCSLEPFLYLVWLLRDISGSSHYGGVFCFVHITNPKCEYEKCHIVLIFNLI